MAPPITIPPSSSSSSLTDAGASECVFDPGAEEESGEVHGEALVSMAMCGDDDVVDSRTSPFQVGCIFDPGAEEESGEPAPVGWSMGWRIEPELDQEVFGIEDSIANHQHEEPGNDQNKSWGYKLIAQSEEVYGCRDMSGLQAYSFYNIAQGRQVANWIWIGKVHTLLTGNAGIVAARVPNKVLLFAGIDDVFTSSHGTTKTLGNFVKPTTKAITYVEDVGEYVLFCYRIMV
ncbi:hypothetical protein L1987_45048 [Smallanthus sonchifolius]|uniref:Uncharacterized protein n=1 Tax=Smallanthus sonchifolius TaxID=185202 RepID=A0ACB9GTA0_9ASTR|nr:hypothetical protein L1987_45048 [Smallanthus sonchifolius]